MSDTQKDATKPDAATPFPLSRTRRVKDIDAVDDVAGYIKVNGREVAVHHLDADAYRAIALMENGGAPADVQLLYDAVERACPELSRFEIDRLSGPKIGAILAVAEQGVKDVEALAPGANDPNAARATETATHSDAPPPSSLETLSATSSPESLWPPTAT